MQKIGEAINNAKNQKKKDWRKRMVVAMVNLKCMMYRRKIKVVYNN